MQRPRTITSIEPEFNRRSILSTMTCGPFARPPESEVSCSTGSRMLGNIQRGASGQVERTKPVIVIIEIARNHALPRLGCRRYHIEGTWSKPPHFIRCRDVVLRFNNL